MSTFLEVKLKGWTATPRLPFVLSGNAICMPTPSYSMLLGMIGCCLGRIVEAHEVAIGFQYQYDIAETDLETRHRLAFDGKLKPHAKGTDAYPRAFHINPVLTIWLNRVDWLAYFKYPVGTPTLGRSQDLLKIVSAQVIEAQTIPMGRIRGCMIPFKAGLQVGGQLIQIAEAYTENEDIGAGRTAIDAKIFMAIAYDSEVVIENEGLFETTNKQQFYLHQFSSSTASTPVTS